MLLPGRTGHSQGCLIPTILGLDPSLAATGAAELILRPDGTIAARTLVIRTKGRRDDTLVDRWMRLEHILDELRTDTYGPFDLAVIEAPAHSTPGGSTWDRAALWWRIVSELLDSRTPVATVAPTTRLKWATGSGRAGQGKAGVVAAMVRMWPDVDAQTDDEWDALAMASMGAQHLGWMPATRAHHRECLTKVRWPECEDGRA